MCRVDTSYIKKWRSLRASILNEMADVVNVINQIRLQDKTMDDGIEMIEKYKVDREINRLGFRTVEAWKLAQD